MSLIQVIEGLARLRTTVREVSDHKILAAADNYTAEDVLSESATAGTAYHFLGMARKIGGSGTIVKAQAFCSKTGLALRINLYLFTKIPSTNLYDNIANTAPSPADWPTYIGPIEFVAMKDTGGGSSAIATPSTLGNVPLPYKCTSTSLYGIAVIMDDESGESASMRLDIKFQVVQD